ncbi:MAG: right-handed parallel beta-helix repeat-containing protein [Planctomycetia bacterium]|nr:right-handed parallel beta-helix repeat-containing protein [Planctomycetia bacterium]
MKLRPWRRWIRGRRYPVQNRSLASRFRPHCEALESRETPANVFVVNSTASDGPGSLRQAILDANATPNELDGPDLIRFAIESSAPSIAPLKALEAITEAVIIDGTTQFGFVGAPLVELNGSLAGAGTHGLIIAANDVVVRGLIINRFSGDGIQVQGSNNEIDGNFIGTDHTGLLDFGNGGQGISIASGSTIGGPTGNTISNNIISGNGGSGVVINSGAFRVETDFIGNTVRGNLIGMNANGEALGNSQHGVAINGSFNRIGGDLFGTDTNLIAFNGQDGVSVTGGDGNTILNNSIFQNGGLGIDLGNDGVTPNDLGDGDLGPNELYNFPELVSYDPETGLLTVVVSGMPTAEGGVLLQFFFSNSADPSGHGEGQFFISETVVGLPPGLGFVFEIELGSLPSGGFITATATEFRTGNTSEFSNVLVVPRTPGGGEEEEPGGEDPTPRPTGRPTSTDKPDPTVSLVLAPPPELMLLASAVAGEVESLLLPPAVTRLGGVFQPAARDGAGRTGGNGGDLRDAISRAYTGEIGGLLFHDLNGDGLLGPEESPLSAHIVFLDANDNGALDDDEWWTITSKKGEYRFPNLAPGRYNVRPLTDAQASQALQAKGYEVKRIAPLRPTAPEVGRRQVELTDSQRTVYGVNFGARVRVRQTPYIPVHHDPDEGVSPDARSRPREMHSPAEEATLPEKSPGEQLESVPPR